MGWFAAPDYWFARLAFERGLAAVYLIACIAAARQFRGLLGTRGLLPIPRYLRRVKFREAPSLFQLHYSDRFFAAVWDILRLLRSDPFPGSSPAFVRIRRYHYRFTSWRELRRTGAWWERRLTGDYVAPVSLRAAASSYGDGP
jgi:Lipase maturation factor